ncbi:MAG: peptidylprolyl isomerase [candidate division Zixibacteria bacterium]|jgi:peptidylprolyl isomerase|nr:peptidylprolyl isomerase [candidate division Zixibacteria bacterium]
MAGARNGDTAKVDYTGRLDDGTVFDSSDGRDPIQFTLGKSQVIAGFEEAVVGMETGQTKTFTIPCDKAYGPHRNENVMTVALKDLNLDFNPKKGEHLTLQRSDGHQLTVEVSDINESEITLDANHPLCGKDLTFDITVVEIA